MSALVWRVSYILYGCMTITKKKFKRPYLSEEADKELRYGDYVIERIVM